MAEYDIGQAFKKIENELIASMMRNMERHRAEETKYGFNWSAWQAEQLKAIEQYKRDNRKKYKGQFQNINIQIKTLIQAAKTEGGLDEEISMLKSIQRGYKFPFLPQKMLALIEKMDGKNFQEKVSLLLEGLKNKEMQLDKSFFQLNDRKLEALITATVKDFEKAEMAMLRMADDQYRRIIYDAQVYANSGAGTYKQAVDMAAKDFLSAGINCIEYKNGARHTMKDYSQMAIRTANKRAALTGAGEKRNEHGVRTVIVNSRAGACERCLPFVGVIFIDDVWSGGTRKDGDYPMLSSAISAGLFHPNCKDGLSTYYPGISFMQSKYTKEEIEQITGDVEKENKRKFAKRQAEKFERMAKNSIDENNKKIYGAKAKEWTMKAKTSFVYNDEPVHYSEHSDYSVALPGYSKEANAGISEAAEKVAKLGDADRREHMQLVNLKTGALAYYETNGEPDVVGIDFWRYIEEHPGEEFAFVHNHNVVSSLSESDLTTPIKYSAIKVQIAVQNDGVKYIAVKKKDAEKKFYADFYYADELEELNKLSRNGKITPNERVQKREEIIIECMINDFYGGEVIVSDGKTE